jgi:hypothetical protein
MRPGLPTACLAAVLAVLVGTGEAAAAKVDTGAGLDLAAGYDSNPLMIAGEGPGGAFGQASFSAGLRVGTGRRGSFFFDAAGLDRRYDSTTRDGDFSNADLRTGVLFPRIRAGRTRISLTAGVLYEIRRSTYTDRLTGGVYEVITDPTPPATTALIPHRFDTDTAGAFLDLSWRLNRRLRLFLDTGVEQTDYVEDYDVITTVDPLDFRTLHLEPGLQVRVNDVLVIVASVGWTDLEFDRQPALDSGGDEVPGTTREYEYTRYRLRFLMTPGRRWHVNVGLLGADRRDTWAGYYDFGALTGFVSALRTFGDRNRLQLVASGRRLDYEHATVLGDPDAVIRGSDVRRFAARFDRVLNRHLGLFAEGVVLRTDSEDPIFTYDRDTALVGVSIRK